MPAKERQQICFLGYSYFIYVNYLWMAFVITFISCMIKFSHLLNIAMKLVKTSVSQSLKIFLKTKFFNMLFFFLRPLRNASGILLGSRARLDRFVARFLR